MRSQTDLSVALVQLKRATGQLLQAAPMPQVSDHFVQQANFEQPVSVEQPVNVGQLPQEQLWSVPATEMQAKSILTNDLWGDER